MTDKLLLNVFQRLKISTNARALVSVYKAKQVAIIYAKLKVKEFADNNESTYEKSKYFIPIFRMKPEKLFSSPLKLCELWQKN